MMKHPAAAVAHVARGALETLAASAIIFAIVVLTIPAPPF